MQEQVDKPWMTVAEVAAYVGISPSTVCRRANAGEIPCAGGPGQVKTFHRETIEAYIRGQLPRPAHGSR